MIASTGETWLLTPPMEPRHLRGSNNTNRKEGQPIYTEFEARKAFRNDSDYITRLHRAVLTACSREFREAGIDKLLSLDELCLSDEKVEDFGDTETLSYRLEHERAIQFIDWKLLTIDLLERFLLAHESEVHRDEMQALGTTAFYKVWEDACKAAFGDALNKRLDDLGFTIEGNWSADSQKKLIEIIPRPQWERWLGDNFGKREDTDTLIPDTITIAEGQGGGACSASTMRSTTYRAQAENEAPTGSGIGSQAVLVPECVQRVHQRA